MPNQFRKFPVLELTCVRPSTAEEGANRACLVFEKIGGTEEEICSPHLLFVEIGQVYSLGAISSLLLKDGIVLNVHRLLDERGSNLDEKWCSRVSLCAQ